MRHFTLGAALAAASIVALAAPAQAQQMRFDIPAGSLKRALDAYGRQSGRPIVYKADEVRGVRSAGYRGTASPDDALAAILANTGFAKRTGASGAVAVVRAAIAQSGAGEPATADGAGAPGQDQEASGSVPDPIVVTGSRIRGGSVASPRIVLDEQAIRDAGQSDLGEVARNLPQSFGGGQNPGVGFNVPIGSGGNIGGGSSVNLRGLGGDATLTLVNGRRLPYDSARQSIDISAIPLAAVDRVEIVADGSSALYGSDAVGGVVNVILKRDFEGVEARARIGASSEGGNVQQQYGALAGTRWRSGGGFVTYEYADATAISSNQRDYASSRPNLPLIPANRRHAAAGSVHQRFSDSLRVEIDGLYNNRTTRRVYPQNLAGNLLVSRIEQFYEAETLGFAGTLHWSLASWELGLSGTYGKSSTAFYSDTFTNDLFVSRSRQRYDNRTLTGEVSADGPLFQLPGGSAKLAVGAGLRSLDFARTTASALQTFKSAQHSRYAYGEVNLPFTSPEQAIPGLNRLNLSAALRYENYRGIDEIVTPKLGLIYSPTGLFDLKASWGRSFRAPGFLQLYTTHQVLLYPVATFGGTGYPTGSTALLSIGGNRELKPETARSWSATLSLYPADGATLELSYFNTRYTDRIVNPIALLAQALSNPIYRDQITSNPSAAAQAALVADADQFLNVVGGTYDPSRVVAIIDSTNTNAGRQSIQGLDALLRYRADIGSGTLRIDLNASYLDSEQQLNTAQPVQALAGMLFNPPHWRARGTLGWYDGRLGLTATLSHTGGVSDTRSTPPTPVPGMTTADLTARYRVERPGSVLNQLELTFGIQNLFNAEPRAIPTTLVTDTPYDSTNYSPVGRFLSFGISKKW